MLIGALAPQPAPARVLYVAPIHESQWLARTEAGGCLLEHAIPGYGSARFVRRGDGRLDFALSAHHAPAGSGFAVLSALAPAWRHPQSSHQPARIALSSEATPVRLEEQQALALLLQLERGLQPSFRYQDDNSAGELVEVRLSTVNFAHALEAFRACAAGMSPAGGRAGEDRVQLRFGAGSAALDAGMRRVLDRLLASAREKPGAAHFVLTGYADAAGDSRRNLALSGRRTLAVLDYLAGRGIRERQVALVARGESPAPDAAVASRSVTVQLLRR